MKCGEVEARICDYLDGTLPDEDRATLEQHLAVCVACGELARDAARAMAFLERTADVEMPPQLVTRILDETRSGRHGRLGASGGLRGWIRGLLAPVLQPRLVMGMALTVLSFSMMAKCAGVSPRQLTAADLEPARVWASLDDRVHRTWNRGVQFYESIRFIYDVRTRIREWTEQQEEEERNASANKPLEERRLPAKVTPAQQK